MEDSPTQVATAENLAFGTDCECWAMRWVPDFVAPSMLVDFEDLRERLGVAATEPLHVLSDLDSTLREVHSKYIDPTIARHLRQQIESGVISLDITTNSMRRDIDDIGLQIHQSVRIVSPRNCGHRKQHPGYYGAAISYLGISNETILVAGDKARRDVLGARRSGLPSLLVDPLGSNELWFDRLALRWADKMAFAIGNRILRRTEE